MLDSILVVHQNSIAERDAEYNSWYTNVHIRDVMRLDGAIAARRFRAHDLQISHDGIAQQPAQRYFTLYECSDQQAVIQGHIDHARTERMPISTAGELAGSYAYFFQPCTVNGQRATVPPADGVITCRFTVAAENAAAFERWFDTVHANAARSFGLAAPSLFTVAERQMAPNPPPHRYFAIYAAPDMAAATHGLSELLQAQAAQAPFSEVLTGCYEPLIPRLTASAVRNASAAASSIERDARAALGDRVYTRATSTFRKN